MRAWIVRWNWVGDHAAVQDPVISILSARISPDEIRTFVQRYYSSHSYSLAEKVSQARYNKPSEPPHPAHFDVLDGHAYPGYISCGHNPFIEAFKASGVQVDQNTGQLLWDEEGVWQDRTRFLDAVKRHEQQA